MTDEPETIKVIDYIEHEDGSCTVTMDITQQTAKLEKAVEALEKVRAFVRELEPHSDQGHTLVPALHAACTTLAELKGEDRG